MARLWSSGAELNSTTANIEITSSSGSPTVDSTTKRSGTYSYRSSTSDDLDLFIYQFVSGTTQDVFYFRTYLLINSAPSGQIPIFMVRSGSNEVSIRLNTDRTLELWNEEDSAQVGSDSSALSLDTWYRIEMKVDNTTLSSTAIEARIDGVSFASGTINLAAGSGLLTLYWGNSSNTTQNIYFDDIAINDDSGSFQNSWPGEGEIIHLRPNADGDEQDWDSGTSADAYTLVDEVTPNDATDYINSTTLDQLSSKNLDATPAAMDSSDIINVVQVGVRYRSGFNGVSSPFVLRIMASSGGTEEESATITNTSSTWSTNAQAAPRNYALTLYDLPGASTTAWTKSDLDTTQIGVRVTTGGGPGSYVSTLWLLVDHKPGAGGGEGTLITGPFMTVNTSFWGA